MGGGEEGRGGQLRDKPFHGILAAPYPSSAMILRRPEASRPHALTQK